MPSEVGAGTPVQAAMGECGAGGWPANRGTSVTGRAGLGRARERVRVRAGEGRARRLRASAPGRGDRKSGFGICVVFGLGQFASEIIAELVCEGGVPRGVTQGAIKGHVPACRSKAGKGIIFKLAHGKRGCGVVM